ncbi:hypothetical protein M514_28379, partial [Trichuris suis]
ERGDGVLGVLLGKGVNSTRNRLRGTIEDASI